MGILEIVLSNRTKAKAEDLEKSFPFLKVINWGEMIKSDLIIPFFIIIMYYLLDSITTLAIRFMKGENIFRAHSSHYYQKAIRNGNSHEYVLTKIIYLNSILLLLAILSIYFPLLS